MDPLSDVLSLLKPRSYSAGGFDLGSGRAIQFPEHPGIKCYAVAAGEGWLVVEGVPEPVQLTAGDSFLLPPGPPFRLATDLSVPPIDFMVALRMRGLGADELSDAGGLSLLGGHFVLEGDPAGLLLRSLPTIVHLRTEADKAAMRWSLERMKEEVRNPQPGGSLMTQQLAYMMLLQALRLHLAEGARGGASWLFALADKQMSAAIACMHDKPGHPWTLETIAEKAGMSRSVFAAKFKTTVGMTPMEYLTRWRMMLAGDRLTNSGDSIAEIAPSLGYDSESAFGKAFRRVMGCSPRKYSHGNRVALRAAMGD